MTVPIGEQLHAFATSLLERRGALVEWPLADQAGTALLPPQLAAQLGAENDVVDLGPEVAGRGLSVNLAGDFLEWAGRLLEAEPRVGVFRVRDLYLKRKELEEGISRAFTWLNAKARFREARETTIEYHTWWFHGTLTSDDRWETAFSVSLNSASGVEVEIPDPLGLWELEPRTDETPVPTSHPRATAVARRRLLQLAAAFLDRMDTRRERDRKRLHDYYQALLRETANKKSRGPTPVDPEKAEAKKRAVQLELRRKLGELDDRYAMSATLLPVVLVRTEVPVLTIDLSIFRKQAHRLHTVYWNPLVKHFDPFVCSACGAGAFAVSFTNDDVEPRCRTCE